MADFNRIVWEGWTPKDFINELSDMIDMIMTGDSFIEPFKTKSEMVEFIKENQPYYKKSIPEVNEYFASKYGLR